MSQEQIKKRDYNRSLTMKALHYQGAIQRSQLNQLYGIRKSSITSIVDELISHGVVIEKEPEKKQSRIQLNHDHNHALIASISLNTISFSTVSSDGSLGDREEIPIDDNLSPEKLASLVCSEFQKRLDKNSNAPMGIGITLPGVIDPGNGIVLRSVYPGKWKDVHLKEMVEKKLGGPVLIDNDVRAQLWSSAWFDRILGRAKNMLYVGLLDGVASVSYTHLRAHET